MNGGTMKTVVAPAAGALAWSMSAQAATPKPRTDAQAQPALGQPHPRWNSVRLAYLTLYATASNQQALAECKHQYGGHRGAQGRTMPPVWIESCYHERTGRYPWQ
jgi:hypothetical protein